MIPRLSTLSSSTSFIPGICSFAKDGGTETTSTSPAFAIANAGEIIFGDEVKRKQLNEIIHPAIRKEMLAQKEQYIKNGAHCVVLDIPLLFESKLTHFVDKIIVVYVDPDTQLQRIIERDKSSKEVALQRINSQIPVSKKVKLADATINNNGTKEDSFIQLKKILKKWNLLV